MENTQPEDIIDIINKSDLPYTAFEIRPATGYNIMSTDADMTNNMSKRFQMWQDFAREVGDHVESYTVPQYGDYPTDQLTEWTLEDLKTTLKRYANRMGSNQRGSDDQKLDMLKIAHYASVAWHKYNNTETSYA